MIQSKRDLAQLNSGFSLMELVVAVVLIAISSIGGTYLFNQATRQAKAISQTLEQQFAISNELAVIRDHNDRYTCATIPAVCKPMAILQTRTNTCLPIPTTQPTRPLFTSSAQLGWWTT